MNALFPNTITIDDVIKRIKTYYTGDTELVRLAYDFAAHAHNGQFRKSGEPYIIHPLAASYLLATMSIDVPIIVATLLHDVPEDTTVTIEDIEKNFGTDVARMVQGITKLGKLKYRGVDRYIENLRKMFVAMAEDARVMIIKFADRVHNLSTLASLPPEKGKRIALESLEIFAPIGCASELLPMPPPQTPPRCPSPTYCRARFWGPSTPRSHLSSTSAAITFPAFSTAF
jgi:GTP pyrophosphokinase